MAKSKGKIALITIPGIGCGQFAGIFRGQLGSMLRDSLKTFLKTHGDKFTHIKVVYYDRNQHHDICLNILVLDSINLGTIQFPLTERSRSERKLNRNFCQY